MKPTKVFDPVFNKLEEIKKELELQKRPSISRDGKTTPWWVLLHEYEIYVLLLERILEKNGIPLPKP